MTLTGRHIELIGIGGCGMSGLARVLHARGATVSGSDTVPSPITEALQQDGIEVSTDQSVAGLRPDIDLIIATAALPANHPVLEGAASRGVEVIRYADALGRLQEEAFGISIAGTHGKSTSCAMCCHALVHAGLAPSFIIGAEVPQLGGGSQVGEAKIPIGPMAGLPGLMVAEACEFNRSFHAHRPKHAAILNIEEDHLDVYHNLDGVIQGFADFAQNIPDAQQGGRLLIAHEGAHRREVTRGTTARVETFGLSGEADWSITFKVDSRDVELHGPGTHLRWRNLMPGEHNALNAGAAAVLALWAGADSVRVEEAMANFTGLSRRTEFVGTKTLSNGEVRVWDDYGHHPTEIDRTLRALRAAEDPRRLVCVFQPHQHSRTRFLLDEFASAFSAADVVIVPEIYFVRDSESAQDLVNQHTLVDRLRRRGTDALATNSLQDTVSLLDSVLRGDDLLVVMGAGPVGSVGPTWVQAS
ncbi:MAG: UDP-N-acetylmuramate--L-alanine ligase [Phycisphaerae bacterium]|nr:UDP-N-acetylmuramate--L-alanine ligase [Phycisphaerae bacterium]